MRQYFFYVRAMGGRVMGGRVTTPIILATGERCYHCVQLNGGVFVLFGNGVVSLVCVSRGVVLARQL
jgi:hypothetical protein